MDIKPFTPMLRMQKTSLYRRVLDSVEDLAVQYGVTGTEIYGAIQDFLTLSLRVDNINGNLDFKFIALSDDAETIKKKFAAYLNTNTPQTVWDIEAAIVEFDTPVDEDLAPGVESEDPE